MKTYKGLVKSLEDHQVFVFGSNPEGRHGAGAARVAADHYGAIMGKGRGHMGKSYGLVTKNLTPNYFEEESGITYVKAGERSVSKLQMLFNLIDLYLYARKNPNLEFLIAYTPAPNLNGYTPLEMAELLLSLPVPNNVVLNEELMELYNEHKRNQTSTEEEVA
jgi:hypothetical protein